MSVRDQNQMLYVLHKNEVSRKNIKWIMEDVQESGIFNDEDSDSYDDWEFLEEQAYWLFDSNVTNEEKITALRSIKMKQEEYEKTKKSQYLLDQEKRIIAKQKELIAKGLVTPDPVSHQKGCTTTTRYGRSPLHEAVAMKDIKLVEKYLKSGKHFDKIDNNGHTAMEMAYYENYKEALILFERYVKSKK